MSQNPYAAYNEPTDSVAQARTSVAAILSLVCSLICCIPGLGAVAAVLGGVALLRISGSNGRRSGVGLAIAGIVIGLLVTMGWGFFAIGAMSVYEKAGKFFMPMIQTVASDDPAKMRAAVSPALAATATDADWKRFRDAIKGELGDVSTKNVNLIQIFKGYGEVGQLMQNKGNNDNAIPLPLVGDKGKGVLLVHLPRNTTVRTPGANGPGSAGDEVLSMCVNFSVILPSGKEEWLVPKDQMPGSPRANPPALPAPTQPAPPDNPKPSGA
jgi:hypothetical protein